MNKQLVHIAGRADKVTQRCARCGVIIWTNHDIGPHPLAAKVTVKDAVGRLHLGDLTPNQAICAPQQHEVHGIRSKETP